ncbi:ankyrin repeat domain-containing protein [Shewanella khirikhana]|uniref:ankyrin repeat domain-containing protein n=1 Tax=Shewanella khirikhana TaxID=1965282 RepID=UPI0030D40D79
MRITTLAAGLLLAGMGFSSVAAEAVAVDKAALMGDWCFYEQEGFGSKVPEKIDINLAADGNYTWVESAFKQTGEWELDTDGLYLAKVGNHKLLSLNADLLELKRGSVMRFKKGVCGDDMFSSQDITEFHNGAAMGKLAPLEKFVNKGIDINIQDWNKMDTALIQAAKFCQTEAGKYLLAKGADKSIKNGDEKVALDYAKASSFHNGCDEMVSLLAD